MHDVEAKNGALYPQDEPGAIGLLFAVDLEDGDRVTVVVDPEWLRTLLSGIDAGADLGCLKVPEEVMLPTANGMGWDIEVTYLVNTSALWQAYVVCMA
jgi:hypothetical protein